MLMIAIVTLSGLSVAASRAPAPPTGMGIVYREGRGPKRRRPPVATRSGSDYYPAVLRWTHVQRRCERTVDNCIIGPPDLLAPELPPTK